MTEELAVWRRLVALLPEAEAEEAGECWSIGEQEAALALLVSGLLTHQVRIGESTRARISVLAEGWGEREALTPRLLRCPGDGEPSPVRLVEAASDVVRGPGDGSADDVLVPWIACERCGGVLARKHAREPWGGLSHLARSYVITWPEGGAVVREFPADAADAADAAHSADAAHTAFEALLAVCAESPSGR
ncbi:hypothetical protein ACFQ8C_01235 [Streptomyces sp. NPDC056503]|uniref:hypothetical protein n=1 Tax=Streptomyces sp. NPDC056503 TaxID=3345842 RepID=UPI0036BC926B